VRKNDCATSTTGGILISQGNILPNESMKLVAKIRDVFSGFGEADGFAVQPDLHDLLYTGHV